MSKKSINSMNNAYLGYVVGYENAIFLFFLDEKTESFVHKFQFSTIQELLKTILIQKSKLKFIILNICMIQTSEYPNVLESSKAVKTFLLLHEIPFQFFTFGYMAASTVMVAANITPNIGDDIVTVRFDDDKIILKFYRFTPDGYMMYFAKGLGIINLEAAANEFCDVMKTCNIQKLILFTLEYDSTMLKYFEKILKSSKILNFNGKLIVIEWPKYLETQTSGNVIIEISKRFFNQSYVKYYIVPATGTIEIMGLTGDSQKKLLSVEAKELLPFKKSIIFNKSVQKCLMLHYYTDESDIIQTLQMNRNCHQRKLTLIVESECFPELKIEPIIIPEIKNLPSKLNELKMEIPVIGFFRQTSFICAKNDKNDEYKFLDSWNGLYGNELFICFDGKKPKYGMNAIIADKTKMSSVIYDLIKIMTMPAEKITKNPNWKFSATKDSENPVLLEFDNYDGTRKAASPAFFMALLLKEHFKAIRNEKMDGQKPKEIGLCVFDKFNDTEMKRLEVGLKESCELLKTSCIFIKL